MSATLLRYADASHGEPRRAPFSPSLVRTQSGPCLGGNHSVSFATGGEARRSSASVLQPGRVRCITGAPPRPSRNGWITPYSPRLGPR